MLEKQSPSLPGLLSILMAQIDKGVITLGQLEMFIGRKNPFASSLDMAREWEKFYLDYFRIQVNLSGLAVPSDDGDYCGLINAIAGYDQIFEAIKELGFSLWFKTGSPQSFCALIENEIRSAKSGPYAISFRPVKDGQTSLLGGSFEGHPSQAGAGLTLMERLIYELKYYSETGDHPEEGWSKCSGTAMKDGGVPAVIFRGTGLEIDIQ